MLSWCVRDFGMHLRVRASVRRFSGIRQRRHAEDLALAGPTAAERNTPFDLAADRKRRDSEAKGVSAAYILGDFVKEAQVATNSKDPAFHEIARHLCYGKHAKGHGLPCPRDGRPGCSFVDALPEAHRGRANIFLSWVWSYKLSSWGHSRIVSDPLSTRRPRTYGCIALQQSKAHLG